MGEFRLSKNKSNAKVNNMDMKKNKCLQKCNKFVEEIFTSLKKIYGYVEKSEEIPKRDIIGYLKLCKDFDECFFSKETIKCVKEMSDRKDIKELYKRMIETKKRVQSFQNKINNPLLYLYFAFSISTLNSYKDFLNKAEKVADNFIIKCKKHYYIENK